MRTVTKSNTEQDFFSFISKRRKYADVLPVLAQNKSIYTWHVHNSPYSSFGRKKIELIMHYEGMLSKFSGAVAPLPSSRSSSFEFTMSVHAVHKLAHFTPPHSKCSPPVPPQPLA